MLRRALSRSALTAAVALSSLALVACHEDPAGPTDSTDSTEQPDGAPRLATAAGAPVSQEAKLAAAGQAHASGADRIPGQYVVVFKDDVQDAPGLARRLLSAHGASPRFTYSGAIKGFSFKLPEQAAERVAAALVRDPHVAYVEQDAVPHTDATQYFNYGDSYPDPWGLDRIDQRWLPLSGSSTYSRTGAGVRVYIIDTGLQASHPEFGGRALVVKDVFGGSGYDCEGHGTHVAATVGGATYGVAKGALIRGVKVLRGRNCGGSESWDAVIAGVDWVYLNRVNPAVANMSLGGGYYKPLNDAVTRLANSGVFVSVAAGNDNANACYYSPASAPGTFTVAASTRSDYKASFSNWGGCVDAYAPGDQILSASIQPGLYGITMSGTSMASPHVAGVAALYKQAYGNAASSTIVNWLVYNATVNAIRNNVTGTPNRLLWKGSF